MAEPDAPGWMLLVGTLLAFGMAVDLLVLPFGRLLAVAGVAGIVVGGSGVIRVGSWSAVLFVLGFLALGAGPIYPGVTWASLPVPSLSVVGALTAIVATLVLTAGLETYDNRGTGAFLVLFGSVMLASVVFVSF